MLIIHEDQRWSSHFKAYSAIL